MFGLIGIIIGIVFIFLLGKAILETIWGTLCLIWGLFLHVVAFGLDLVGYGINAYREMKSLALWHNLFPVVGSLKNMTNRRLRRHAKMWLARLALIVGYTATLLASTAIITAVLIYRDNPIELIEIVKASI